MTSLVFLAYTFFSVRLLSVLRGHSFFSSLPQRPMTSDYEGFLYQMLSITLFSYLNSWERASIFPYQCWVLNKGTTGTIFITSLVWRGPRLGIEFFPGILTIENPQTSCLHEIEIYTLTICLFSTGGDVKEDSAPESSIVYGSLHETTSFSYCYKVCTEFYN